MKKRFCERCGKELNAEEQFCTECGYKGAREEKGKRATAKKSWSNKLVTVVGIASVVVVSFTIIGAKDNNKDKSEVSEGMKQMIEYEESGALDINLIPINDFNGMEFNMTVDEFVNEFEQQINNVLSSSDSIDQAIEGSLYPDKENLQGYGYDDATGCNIWEIKTYQVMSSEWFSVLDIYENPETNHITDVQYQIYHDKFTDIDTLCMKMTVDILGGDWNSVTENYSDGVYFLWDDGIYTQFGSSYNIKGEVIPYFACRAVSQEKYEEALNSN